MVYLYVEDSNEGLYLMKLTQQLYNIGSDSLIIDTFNGIFEIVKHVQNLTIQSNDSVYYVYDNIEGNTDVPRNLQYAKNTLIQKGIHNNVIFIPIVCCEYSILVAEHMEMFFNKDVLMYCLSLKACKSEKLTTETKQLSIFHGIYNNIRNRQKNRLIARKKSNQITENDVELTVTAEKLCKYILHEALKGDLIVYDKSNKCCGNCWENDCCIKTHKRSCNISVKSVNLSLLSIEKKKLLLQGTHFYKVLSMICNKHGIACNNKAIIELNNIQLNNKIKEKIDNYYHNVSLCIQNIYAFAEMGADEDTIIEKCKYANFDDYIIKKAMNEITIK